MSVHSSLNGKRFFASRLLITFRKGVFALNLHTMAHEAA
ncbi:MAG TPA: hypothetical protein DEB17_07955 [Chlorobaculum sp.]|uniref:Uncharacterized protein n=1 Tax=Chlorobaculum tepidum (strain ATCC 49652 / DSM 12025 / NBRC 103806 / TLS) TaxID=194439 RepID=Q8KD32_CHLTE|nr:hypothetical protein CT1223 [Chlorobaculum tepidum TLS]HBU23905.1 hypothetical protein [Chlorobaculum sp.]